MRISGDISICYSGGLDSTFAALLMAKNTQSRIHLVTFLHNYGLLFPQWSEIHVKSLKCRFGEDRIIHSYHNITNIFKRITLDELSRKWQCYGGHCVWCLGCTLSMTTRAVIYNLERSIPNILYCSSVGGQYSVMSMPVTIMEEKAFCREYGINFCTPILDLNITKPEERKLLKENRIWLGYRIRRGHHGIQPICLPGLQHIGDVLFDLHTTPNPENIQRFVEDNKAVMRGIIEAYFKEKNMDIQGLVRAVKSQRERCKEIEIKAG